MKIPFQQKRRTRYLVRHRSKVIRNSARINWTDYHCLYFLLLTISFKFGRLNRASAKLYKNTSISVSCIKEKRKRESQNLVNLYIKGVVDVSI